MATNPSNGLRRRSIYSAADDAALAEAGEARLEALRQQDVSQMSETGKAFRQGLMGLRATVPAVGALGLGLLGEEEGAVALANDASAIQEQAAAEGPEVQNIDQIEGVGDALAYARNLGVGQLPNVALAAATGGVGALARGGLGVSAQAALGRQVASRVAQRAATKKGLDEAGQRAVFERVLPKATRRAPTPDPARLIKQGAAMGGAVAGSVLQTGQIAPALIGDTTSGANVEERATAALFGSLLTGSLEALPVMKLFGRYGAAAPLKAALKQPGVAARIAKEAVKQGGVEGATEVAQTLGEKITHRWVNENIDVLGEDALAEYMNAFVGGATAGAIFGGPAGLKPGQTLDTVREKAREKFKSFTKPAEGVEVKDGVESVEVEFDRNLQAMTDDEIFDDDGELDTTPFDMQFDPNTGQMLRNPRSNELKGLFDAEGMKALVKRGIPKRDALALSLLDPEFAGELHATKPEVVRSATEYLLGNPLDEAGQARADVFLRALPAKTRAQVIKARAFAEAANESGQDISFDDPRGNAPGDAPTNLDEKLGEFTQERTAAEDAAGNNDGLLTRKQLKPLIKPVLGKAVHDDGAALIDLGDGKRRQFNLRGAAGALLADPANRSLKEGADVDRVVNALALSIVQARGEDMKVNLASIRPGFKIGNVEVTPEVLTQVRRALATPAKSTPVEGSTPVTRLEELARQAQQAVPRPNTGGNFTDRADGGEMVMSAGGKNTTVTRQGNRAETLSDRDDPSTQPVPLVAGTPQLDQVRVTEIGPTGKNDPVLNAQTKARRELYATIKEIAGVDPTEDPRTAYRAALAKATPDQKSVLQARAARLIEATQATEAQVRNPRGVSVTEGQPIQAGKVDTRALRDEQDVDAQIQAVNDRITAVANNAQLSPERKRAALAQLRKVRGELNDRKYGRKATTPVKPIFEREVGRTEGTGVDPAKAAKVGEKPKPAKRAKKGKSEPKPQNRKVKGQQGKTTADLLNDIRRARAEADSLRAQKHLTPGQRKAAEMMAKQADIDADRSFQELERRAAEQPTLRAAVNTGRSLLRKSDVKVVDAMTDDDIETAAEGKPDDAQAALQAMADELAAKLGVPKVTIQLTDKTENLGDYDKLTRIIRINPRRKGAQRIEILLHEFGHHVHWTAYRRAPKAVRKAIFAEYKAWLAARSTEETKQALRKTRTPASLAERIADIFAGQRLSELDAKTQRYELSFREWLADNMARAMSSNPDTQSIVGKFFSEVAAKLKELYSLVVGNQPKYAPAPSVEAWVRTLLNPPPPAPRAQLISASDYASILNPEERGLLEQLFRAADVEASIRAQVGPEVREAIDNYGTRLETLINAGVALWLDGKLVVNPKQRGAIRNVVQFLKQAFGIATNQDLARVVLRDIKRGKVQRDPKRYSAKRELRPVVQQVDRFYQTRVRPVYDRLMESVGVRLRNTNVPALRQLVAKIDLMSGERGGETMSQALFRERGRLMSRYLSITDPLTDKQKIKLRQAMQRGTPPKDPALLPAYTQLTAMISSMWSYGRTAGIEMGKRQTYFPVMMDPENVAAREDELRALYTKYLPQIKKMLDDRGISFKDENDALDIMIKAAKFNERDIEGEQVHFSDGESAPGFRNRRPRLSAFIYEAGNADDIKLFQTFQEKRLDKIMVNYVDHIVKRAEFTRRFSDGALTDLLDRAKQQGASDGDLQLARDYIDASLGTYNKRVSPVLKSIFGAIDGVLGTHLAEVDFQKFAAVQSAIATYQNLRLLGLAALSSLIDPIGNYVRTSDAKVSFKAFRDAMKAMSKSDPEGLRAMAEMLGVVEKGAITELLSYTYGTGIDAQGTASKINAMLFKVNGLEFVTKFSRMMALSAGHQFLLKHAAGRSADSERYLRELNIKASDIVRDPRNPNFVVINDATREALYRFVDEAVVRPRPQQKPLWHSDPNFALVSQYKGYLYSFYNTVIARAMVEIKHGNFGVAAPLALYIPVTMLAEAAREMVQFGPEGDDRREEWELDEHMGFALSRSGLLGPKISSFADARVDLSYGSTMANSFIGPTAQQLGDLGETAIGGRKVTTTAVDALPGSAIFEDYLR